MISVIMPIYNGAQFIDNSISSILKEKQINIELILVNDGSTDNSLDICNKYAQSDKRIKIINKENGGICSARNAGIKAASGEYISFCDQDDEIKNNIYSVFANSIIREKPDLIISGKELKLIDTNGNIIKSKIYSYENKVITNERQITNLMLNINRDICLLHIWNCAYKKNIIEKHNILFDKHFRFGMEDTMFNIEYGIHCNKVVLTNDIVYAYSQRLNISTSTKWNDNYLNDYKYFTNKMFQSFQSVYQNKYDSDVYLFCLRFGIKVFNYSCIINNSISQSILWKDIYSNLIPHETKHLLYKPVKPFFMMLWCIGSLSGRKKYCIVAKLLNFIRHK